MTPEPGAAGGGPTDPAGGRPTDPAGGRPTDPAGGGPTDPAGGRPTEAERRRVFDEGLQAERTALAWDRTALTTLVVGALLARVGGTALSWVWAAAVAVLVVGAVGLLLGRTRYVRRDASMRGELAGPSHALLAGAGVTAVGVSLLALAVTVGLTVAGP